MLTSLVDVAIGSAVSVRDTMQAIQVIEHRQRLLMERLVTLSHAYSELCVSLSKGIAGICEDTNATDAVLASLRPLTDASAAGASPFESEEADLEKPQTGSRSKSSAQPAAKALLAGANQLADLRAAIAGMEAEVLRLAATRVNLIESLSVA